MPSDSPRPIITLTTDFGLSDHYVGTVKGVLLSRCPSANVADISHDIPPFSLYAAAYTLDQSARYFPTGTVHLVVVDPGVGTIRRAIVARVSGHTFVAPDNGVLSLIATGDPNPRFWQITNSALWLSNPSNTFHGRDIFAPVAGSLAAGAAKLADVGPELTSIQMLPELEPKATARGVWSGRVFSVDHFGNVITNFAASRFAPGKYHIEAGGKTIGRFQKTFGEGGPDVCFAYAGSSGYVELGINQKSAGQYLQVRPGDLVTLRESVA
jgi:hypothetical protein